MDMETIVKDFKTNKEKRDIEKGDVFRHFKGTDYLILELGIHTETKEAMVIYIRALNKDKENPQIWIRPMKMFLEKTDKIKYPNHDQEFRFEFVDTLDNYMGKACNTACI